MPYMERQFLALTGVKLKGLSQFTGWIKPGSYYHAVVARKGQLNMYLHLAGTVPPRGPQIHPSETQALTQKKVDTPATSHPMPGREEKGLKGHALTHPFPWRQKEWVMAVPGRNRLRQAPRKSGGETEPPSGAGLHLGDEKFGLPIPSCCRTVKESMRLYSSSTVMQVSVLWPIMMWLPREWPATTLIWRWAWPKASIIWYSV